MTRFLEPVYFLCAFAGAILIALNVGVALWGYALFLTSSILGAYIAYASGSPKSILYVNVMFGAINVLGIVRAI